MLPSCLYYILVHLSQKARLGPELSPKFLSTLGPNPTRKARPDLQLCLELTIYRCLLGKDTSRVFFVGAKQSTQSNDPPSSTKDLQNRTKKRRSASLR